MSPTRCPYCGKKISYFKAFFIRRRGEYFCKKCKKESNIHIKKSIWLFFIVVLLMSLAIMGFYTFFTNKENLWFLLFVLIPFIVFYLFSPLFIRLRPKMKFQDSLYDTEMVDNANDPDPTMQESAKVVPTFVDDVILGDDDYKPAINSDIFNAIKEERKVVGETDGGTKSFDRFENISSRKIAGDTMPVGNLKDIPVKAEEKTAPVVLKEEPVAEVSTQEIDSILSDLESDIDHV